MQVHKPGRHGPGVSHRTIHAHQIGYLVEYYYRLSMANCGGRADFSSSAGSVNNQARVEMSRCSSGAEQDEHCMNLFC